MFTGLINPEIGVAEYSIVAARIVGISDEWSRCQLYDHFFDLLCEAARATGKDLEEAVHGSRAFHVNTVSRRVSRFERITVYEWRGMIQFSRRWMLEAALNFPGIRVPARTGIREFDLPAQMNERYEGDFTPRVDVEGDPNVFRDPSGR